jgi:hypothetical protein
MQKVVIRQRKDRGRMVDAPPSTTLDEIGTCTSPTYESPMEVNTKPHSVKSVMLTKVFPRCHRTKQRWPIDFRIPRKVLKTRRS